MLKAEFSKDSIKFLKKCDDILYKRIVNKIKDLSKNPFPSNSVRIINRKEKIFRVRVGDYRRIYEIFYDKNTLVISEINKRSKIY